jgi:hypothetical protein
MIQVGKRYRAPGTLDIDFDVVAYSGVSETNDVVTIKYWNRHYAIYQGNPETLFLDPRVTSKWVEVAKDFTPPKGSSER